MPPKEKANELYDKFFDTTVADITKAHGKAKHCAIIAVDEIIKDIKDSKPFFAFRYYSKYEIRIEYWQEVKQEIEKI